MSTIVLRTRPDYLRLAYERAGAVWPPGKSEVPGYLVFENAWNSQLARPVPRVVCSNEKGEATRFRSEGEAWAMFEKSPYGWPSDFVTEPAS